MERGPCVIDLRAACMYCCRLCDSLSSTDSRHVVQFNVTTMYAWTSWRCIYLKHRQSRLVPSDQFETDVCDGLTKAAKRTILANDHSLLPSINV